MLSDVFLLLPCSRPTKAIITVQRDHLDSGGKVLRDFYRYQLGEVGLPAVFLLDDPDTLDLDLDTAHSMLCTRRLFIYLFIHH